MIPNNDNHLSFGRYLQACRLKRGVDLATLSRELKINTDTLTAIENEDYAKMPESVFVKGFLRSFAGAVGADAERAVQSYVDSLAVFNKVRQAEHNIEKENEFFWRRLGLSAFTLMVLIILTIVSMGRDEKAAYHATPKNGPPAEAPAVATPSVSEAGEASIPSTSAPCLTPESESDKPLAAIEPYSEPLLLAIDTLEETWIKIIIDNQKPNEYTLQPGDYLELGAKSRFNILVGNATGVHLYLNGKPVPVSGEQGEVVNIEIP